MCLVELAGVFEAKSIRNSFRAFWGRLQWGKMGTKQFMRFLAIFCCVHGKYVQIIGLKVPGNYLDRFWSNKTLVLLCEGP